MRSLMSVLVALSVMGLDGASMSCPSETVEYSLDGARICLRPCLCVPFYQCQVHHIMSLSVSAGGTWTREEYVGGGALIHPRVVLTAAHKVKGKAAEMLKCRAGEWSRTAPSPQAQERRVAKLHQHPEYVRRYTANDVTLLRLTEPFDMSLGAVRPLCVGRGPPPRADLCVTMGWGRRPLNNSDHADTLKKITAPLVTRDVCWRALQAVDAERRRSVGLEPAERPELHPSLLCAGGLREHDTCAGDGGSPLVCEIQKMNATRVRYAAYGLVAWGLGCGEQGAPGVYVDVAKLHEWIITTVKSIIDYTSWFD